MPSHDLKHLRFDYHVPSDNLMDWKGQLPVVHVQYSLHWNKKVTLDGYSMKPGIAVQIKDWNRLESDLQLAAENNSEGHRLPGDFISKQVPKEVDVHYNSVMHALNPAY
jgi:hypothetical protein